MQTQVAKNMIRSLGLMTLVVLSHADLMDECQSKGTCADDDTATMLQNRVSLKEAFMDIDMTSFDGDGQEKLAASQKKEKAVQSAVFEIVMNGGDPSISEKLLDVVEAEMEKARKDLVSEHKIVQQQMDDAGAAVVQCNTNMLSTQDGSVAEAQNTSKKRKTIHHACRGAEKSAYDAKTSSCKIMVSKSETTCKAAPSCNCKDGTMKCKDAGSVLNCLDAQIEWAQTYKKSLKAQKADCDTKTSAWSSQAATCDTDQSNYEVAVCSYAKDLESMCSTLDTCYSEAIVAYGSTEKMVKVQEKDMKAMMASAKKTVCFFAILRKGSKGKVTMKDYKLCVNLNVSSDRVYLNNTMEDMAIVYEPAVSQEKCKTMSSTPGDGKWAGKEYAQYNKDWLRETAVCPHKTKATTITTTIETTTAKAAKLPPGLFYTTTTMKAKTKDIAGGCPDMCAGMASDGGWPKTCKESMGMCDACKQCK